MAEPERNLRERKKARMRQLIADTAQQLFAERGFDHVTIKEIARRADVAEQTVFNYFPRKEDLVYARLGSFERQMLAAIRDRPAGESVAAAFRRFLGEEGGLLGGDDPAARAQLAALTRMITESPALLAREEQIFAGYTASLAALIAAEQDSEDEPLSPWIVAATLMSVHRALISYVRRLVTEDPRRSGLAQDVQSQADRAFALIETGLRDYGVKPS